MSNLDLASSYLDDVETEVQSIAAQGNPFTAESQANDVIKGDLKLALREIDNSSAAGADVSAERARALFVKGLVCNAVCTSIRNYGNSAAKGMFNKWMKKATEAFLESIQYSPSGAAYYNLGLSYSDINKKQEAVAALRQVEQFGDKDLTIEAAKMIGRLEEKKSGCYIATACYGSYDHPDVMVFRRYRDDSLARTLAGRTAIRFYYRVSPFVAQRLGGHNSITRSIRRRLLEPLAARLRRRSF